MTFNANDAAHTITAADGTLVPVPQEYICPLTLDVMTEPLLSREGHNYEREAILSWVADNGTSPLTREPLRPSQLLRNRTLEAKIHFFLKQHGVANDAVVDNGDDEVAFKFVGYIVSDSKQKNQSMDSMSLSSLIQVTRPQTATTTTAEEPQGNNSQDHLAMRRRQIADLIMGAMEELDEF